MRIAQYSTVGPRDNLEDIARAMLLQSPSARAAWMAVLMLLDGAGGLERGEVASALGIRCVASELAACWSELMARPDLDRGFQDEIHAALGAALQFANQTILQQAQQDPTCRGMATTVVCGTMLDNRLHVAWAGDSRLYLYRQGSLHRLTRDHTQVAELLGYGLIGPEEAKRHPAAHTLTRWLGQAENFRPELLSCPLLPDDVILLCSDGLTDVVSDTEIRAAIIAHRVSASTFDDLPRHLIEQALCAGTRDNVTVLCCEYQPDDHADSHLTDRTLTAGYPAGVVQLLPSRFKETLS